MYDKICTWANLRLAFKKAARGKRGRPAAAAFEFELEDRLVELQDDLQARHYEPGTYLNFYIHEPKRRLISAAPFRDRVVHHALCNVIEPVFERLFIPDSYANRIGKGTHRALDRAQYWARRRPWFLHIDLQQFFPSIDHAILRETLAAHLPDTDVMALIDRILVSGEGVHREVYEPVLFPGDTLFDAVRPRGLPIGNLTSQFWANVYMNPFDHFVQRGLGCGAYLRYVDDFLLFADSKYALWDWLAAIDERLATLRVTRHPGIHPRRVTDGIPFLGFVIFPHKRRLKRRKGLHFQRKLAGMLLEDPLDLERIQASVQGWTNHVRYGNTVGLREAVLAPWLNRKIP